MTARPEPSPEEVARLIERVRAATKKDWRLDDEVIKALGGQLRRVSRLTLNGRSAGSDRVFWPHTDPNGKGASRPSSTRSPEAKAWAIRRLAALLRAEREP